MEQLKRQKRKKIIAASLAACIFTVGSAGAAYAANLGGIQRTLQIWIHGEQTNATMQFDGNGNYQLEYTDSAGQTRQQGGGGVAFNPDGSERPLTEAELVEQLNAPDVQYLEDGSVWLYWHGQKQELTDKFEDGICYVKLLYGEQTLYVTVKYQDGYAYSPNKYINALEFH